MKDTERGGGGGEIKSLEKEREKQNIRGRGEIKKIKEEEEESKV